MRVPFELSVSYREVVMSRMISDLSDDDEIWSNAIAALGGAATLNRSDVRSMIVMPLSGSMLSVPCTLCQCRGHGVATCAENTEWLDDIGVSLLSEHAEKYRNLQVALDESLRFGPVPIKDNHPGLIRCTLCSCKGHFKNDCVENAEWLNNMDLIDGSLWAEAYRLLQMILAWSLIVLPNGKDGLYLSSK